MSEKGGAALFEMVHESFARRGVLGRALRIEHQGRLYSVRCDDDCFTVYRINDRPFLPPGLPGWSVCRLGRAECFSLELGGAACPLPQDEEHLAQARAWAEMVLARLDS